VVGSFSRSLLWVLRGARRGAVAVEAAVVIPILIVLMMAVVDFGRFFFAELTARQAVSEASRALALGQTPAFANGVATSLLDGIPTMAGDGIVSFSSTECPADGPLDGSAVATAQVSFAFDWLTPLGLLAQGDQVAVLPATVSQSSQSVCRS